MNTPESIAYTAVATVTGGRKNGQGTTSDGAVDLALRSPKELGGPGNAANPESLFAIGYGACFQGAMGLIEKEFNVKTADSTLTVEVGLGKEGESFAITVKITGKIEGVDAETTQKILERTHEVCPYSKAIAGNVPVELVAEEG